MRLLVTRPEPGASRTAALLEDLGHEPVVLPLSRVIPMAPANDPGDDPAGFVAASSSNALRHAAPDLLARLSGRVCHVVGDSTAAAARAAGLRVGHVMPGAGALGRRLARELAPGTRLDYLCGRIRLPTIEDLCLAAGIVVYAIETYDTETVTYTPAELAARLSVLPFDGVLLYSRVAAAGFRALLASRDLSRQFDGAELFCLSSGIADALGTIDGARVVLAAEPSETALLARIGRAG